MIKSNRTQMTQIKLINADRSARFRVIILAHFLLLAFIITGCGKNYTPEQKSYIDGIEKYRSAKNLEMKNDPYSPFNKKTKVQFHDLKYFDPDPEFVFTSKLTEYNPKEEITVYGTKGEPRSAVRYGYLNFVYKNQSIKLNVYKSSSGAGGIYYSIWFTDKTTNNETYGVGRYLEFEKSDDPENIYKIDFNLAFNPYCAYSPDYSCAIPTKEDFIPIEIRAGEKKFHD
ncbi:MAG: hypothetical protein CVV24_10915 [Ignavibacteriae bacterium HGW-Ignavibacteriae-3]|nr:MAG: hypothetical protein CVV24_10915 [Ignavibacteriae bacterium HGW-Ignavibacteriae-3]